MSRPTPLKDESTAAYIRRLEAWKAQGAWTPANAGTETEFTTRTGRRLLYVYQARSGRHAYLDLDTDLILTDEEARLALDTY